MNAAEAGLRAWLTTPGGRVFAAQHGGPSGALAELYRLDEQDTDAARALADEMERTRGRRPDFGEAKQIVHRPAPGQLAGSAEDIARTLNRYDPAWRVRVDAAPERPMVPGPPWRTD